jgi:hypothetical protein
VPASPLSCSGPCFSLTKMNLALHCFTHSFVHSFSWPDRSLFIS